VTRTYLFGYGAGPWGASPRRRTRDEVLAAPQFAGVDPEVMRRLFALADMVIDGGSDYGFGGGWRSSAQQRELFLSRHTEVPVGGCCRLDGKRYALKAGAAHAAPPGRSYHEETTAAGRALAVDMVGDHKRANPLAAQFGLVHFADVNGEPWHYQPVEIARARSSYNGPDPLPVWGAIPPPVETFPPSPRSRPMWVICRNRNTAVYHVSDGVWRRSVGTNPDPIIWASVASGYPLRDAATGKQVGQASDVTDVDAPFIEGLGVVAREVPR